MNFTLSEDRQMLQDTLRRYLRDTGPEATEEVLWQGLSDLGIPGALFSEAQGGFGGAGFDIALVFEELGRAGVTVPMIDTSVLAGGLIAAMGGAGHQGLVAQIIAGHQVAFAHGEPGARYRLAHVATTAVAGDGYILNGHKSVVMAPGADQVLISARCSGALDDTAGISLFLVPMAQVDRRPYPLQGGGQAAELTFADLRVPKHALIGAEGQAFNALETAHARATLAICAEALGLMEAIRALTVDYLRTRQQFGQPIGKFQALQHRMADMLIEVEQARSAVINLAGNFEGPRDLRERHVSATKNLIGRVAHLVVQEAIQMHGGIGMTQDYALGHLAKRLTMVDHRFGDSDHHLERFIALGSGMSA